MPGKKSNPPTRKYITSFRPASNMPEAIAFAADLGADILYQSDISFAAMVDDLQHREIEEFIIGQE